MNQNKPERYLFISDLHLSSHTKGIHALFHYFIHEIAPQATALFILGDFFDAWLGSDMIDPLQKKALEALKALAESGCSVYFIQGNRDFLLSQTILASYHIQLLADPSCLSLCDKKILLCHGDHLCTLDIQYQRYKKIIRHPLMKWLLLHLSKKWRLKIARALHRQNPHGQKAQDPRYFVADATPFAIEKEITAHQPNWIIHGHTHRRAKHQHGPVTRFVLGDWTSRQGNYLEITPHSSEMMLFQQV